MTTTQIPGPIQVIAILIALRVRARQPLLHIALLNLFELDTAVHSFQALLQGAFGAGRTTVSEEMLHIVAFAGGAEVTQR